MRVGRLRVPILVRAMSKVKLLLTAALHHPLPPHASLPSHRYFYHHYPYHQHKGTLCFSRSIILPRYLTETVTRARPPLWAHYMPVLYLHYFPGVTPRPCNPLSSPRSLDLLVVVTK